MSIQKHFSISDDEWSKIGLTDIEIFREADKFDFGSGKEISAISLMHYVDEFGEFFSGTENHQKIANAIFNSLESSDQLNLIKNWSIEDGDEE